MNKLRNWFHCELVFWVNIFNLDFGFQIDSVEQPVKSNSVGSGHVSHRRTLSFNYHFDQLSACLSIFLVLVSERRASVSCMLVCLGWTLLLVERNTSITMSQRSRAGNPSIRNPASREMISDSVELCETAVCFLHIQLTGKNVLLPKIPKTLLEVDFESSRSPAQFESWNKPSPQRCAVCPTWQYCRKSFVWWM